MSVDLLQGEWATKREKERWSGWCIYCECIQCVHWQFMWFSPNNLLITCMRVQYNQTTESHTNVFSQPIKIKKKKWNQTREIITIFWCNAEFNENVLASTKTIQYTLNCNGSGCNKHEIVANKRQKLNQIDAIRK